MQIRGIHVSGFGLNGLRLALMLKVVDNAGTTVRGTLFSLAYDDTALKGVTTWNYSSAVNRRYTVSTSEVTSQANDRIVAEIGSEHNPAFGGQHDAGFVWGDSSSSDLPEDDTSTNNYNPWLEFPNTITFASAGGSLLLPDRKIRLNPLLRM
jgi:hypothetical protein